MPDIREHSSLKQRLLLLSTITVLVVWIGATVFTYFDAREEFDEILDAHLAQSASLLVVQAGHELEEIETEQTPLPHKYSRQVAFQIWSKEHVLRLHSADAPQSPLANNDQGFSDKVIDGSHWRVFSTWDESHSNLIQVAERADARAELSHSILGNLLKPLWFSLPLLAILLWVAITRGLQPLVRLTGEVAKREPDNLAPLDAGTAPREVVPLIERLNRLFVRIDSSLQKERRFTADAAHELRTPVAAIKAQAQVARAAFSDDERIHALDNAIIGCDRAAHLIDQLLTLARIDTLNDETTELCSFNAIAAEVIASIAPAALSKEVHLELEEGDEVVARGNPILLRILVRNLIDNAVRHTNPRTMVRISVTHGQDRVSLVVTDNGPGIPESEMGKVAERFYRPLGTKASGSGLGLSIVRRIAEVHDASLQLAPAKNGEGLSATVIFKS